MGGGSKTEIIQPKAPPAPSTADAIKEYVKAQPQLFQLQLEQAPLEAQQQLELAQQYAAPLGQAYLEAQEQIHPGLAALNNQITQQTTEGINQGLSPDEIEMYKDQFKSLVGSQVNSGLGADFISKNLLSQNIARKDYFRNLGLSMTGRQPLAQPQSPSYTNQLAGFTPASALSYIGGNYASRLGYERPIAIPGQQSNTWGNIAGIMGGLGGMMYGFGNLHD